jgi:hypothetical protein
VAPSEPATLMSTTSCGAVAMTAMVESACTTRWTARSAVTRTMLWSWVGSETAKGPAVPSAAPHCGGRPGHSHPVDHAGRIPHRASDPSSSFTACTAVVLASTRQHHVPCSAWSQISGFGAWISSKHITLRRVSRETFIWHLKADRAGVLTKSIGYANPQTRARPRE